MEINIEYCEFSGDKLVTLFKPLEDLIVVCKRAECDLSINFKG